MSVDYFSIVLNAIFTGIGVTLGSYFTNSHLIKKSEKLYKRMKRKIKSLRLKE